MSELVDIGSVNIMSSMMSDFNDIKSQSRLSDDRFAEAIKFCLLLSEKKDKVSAYMEAFGETDRKVASKEASRLVHVSYINKILNRMITSNHIMYCDKHYSALEELYNIGMNGSDEKNRVQALSKFIDATKKPEVKDAPVTINLGMDMLDKLESHLKMLSDNAKVLMKDGSIIDAELIK